MNNTINHVSDKSVYVTFDPTGTQWPATFTNVQAALADIGSWARRSVGLPVAAVGTAGVLQIATNAEITAGTDNTKAVTPAGLAFRLQNPKASQTVWGYTKYATDAEAIAVANDLVSITPRSLNVVFNTRFATEALRGSARLSTTPQATAGTDDTTVMTPLKVKQAISALVPVQANATESAFGLVKLATIAQVQAGTVRDGFAISPYTFARLTATEANIGVLRIASQGQVNAGTDDSTAVTPLKLNNMRASGSQFGVVKLSTTLSGAANTALSSNAQVLPSTGNAVISFGAVYQDSAAPNNKYQTRNEINVTLPIGSVWMAAFQNDYGNVAVCNGRGLNKNEFPELFAMIGYTYGGGGDIFNIPDIRGVVVRGNDLGRGIDTGRGYGSYQDDMFRSHEHALQMIYQNGGNIPASQAFYELAGANKNDQRVVTLDGTYSKAQAAGGNETRMKNINLNYVIRLK